eukprot:2482598-Prymnesium_polylepis.1
MVDVLTALLNYSRVALLHSMDAYGSGSGVAFADHAFATGLSIVSTMRFAKNSPDFSAQLRMLQQSAARVVVLFAQASDGSRFLRTALEAGVGGEGYLWLGGDTFAGSGLWESDPVLESDTTLRQRVLKGFFAVAPGGQPEGLANATYQGYLMRRQQLAATRGNNVSCDLGTDEDGTYLWAQDHDNNASTPLACAGYDPEKTSQYDAFGYDAVFAIAHALHDLIEVQNRTELVGSELRDTLVKRVQFVGATGEVDFYDASADPDRLYEGDRRVGVAYSLLNFVDSVTGLAM